MKVKFSEDVVSLTALKTEPAKVIKQANKSQRPILITNRGKGVAVVLSLETFEKMQEELEMKRDA